MSKSSRDEDEGFEEQPRPRAQKRPNPEGEEGFQDKSKRRPPPPPQDEEEQEDRPRRRRPAEDDEEERGALGAMIPYKNGLALTSYYCGMVGLIAILGSFVLAVMLAPNPPPILIIGLMFGLGGILALCALIFGIMGISYANRNPKAGGTGHAVVGLVLGILEGLGLVAVLLLAGVAVMR